MEKPATGGFVRQQGGVVVRLPPGFRFHPTDEELVVQYLKRKAFSHPLPAAVIPDIELSRFDPWDLPGSPARERYFFNMREAKYPSGNRPNRATASGYWKATGKDKPIVAVGCNNQVVGMKKVLVFYRGKPPHGSRTDWIMHEYRLAGAGAQPGILPCPQRKNSTHSSTAQMEDWVLCRISLKRRAAKEDVDMDRSSCDDEGRNEPVNFIDFMSRRSDDDSAPPPPPPRSSSSDSVSSCVTEVSDGSSCGEESCCNSTSSSTSRREAS